MITTLKGNFQLDDHANPSLLVRPDGRLIVFWSAHIGGAMFYRRSVRPEDVTAWEAERTVPTNSPGPWGYTYPNPVQLSAEGNRIWLFWRGGNFNPTFSTSSDEVTWAPARTLVTMPGQRPYVKVAGNGVDTIHFAFTQGHPRNVVSNIYYARYRAGSLFRANGTLIRSLANAPIAPSQADVVYNAAAHGGVKAWVHDVGYDSAGRPVITFATFPTNGDHRYHYARWDGTRWVDREIARAGASMSVDTAEPNYSGGITLDHENPSMVYLARQVGGVFEVELWRTPNGGATWTRRAVTGSSARGNYRPISPRGQTGADLNVVWMRGGYPSFTRYQTAIDAETLSRTRTTRRSSPRTSAGCRSLPVTAPVACSASRSPAAGAGGRTSAAGRRATSWGRRRWPRPRPTASTSSRSKRPPGICCTGPGSPAGGAPGPTVVRDRVATGWAGPGSRPRRPVGSRSSPATA